MKETPKEWFTPRNPVIPIYKDNQTRYCHTMREYNLWTAPKSEGGNGEMWSPDYQYEPFPKLLSHPDESHYAVVKDEKELAEHEARGWNFNHFENMQRKQTDSNAMAPSFDPASAEKIRSLEKEVDFLKRLLIKK